MIPELKDLTTLQTRIAPSKTYRINFETGRVIGMVDGIEALAQSIRLALNTERYAKVIYTGRYGVQFEQYIGQPLDLVLQDLERVISEALLSDNRIQGVSNFSAVPDPSGIITASFTVRSIEGLVDFTTEVIIQ